MQTFEDGYGQYNMPEPDGLPRPAEASRVMGHIGGSGGFRSALWHSPNNGITIALAVNQFSTDPNTLATRAFDAVLTAQDR